MGADDFRRRDPRRASAHAGLQLHDRYDRSGDRLDALPAYDDPDKPFFVYFAPGALHAPHHTPKEWRDKYKGKFDEGWDKYREETLARQKQLGVVPNTTQLAPWAPGVKHWDELSADEKKVAERLMENYAGFGEYADHEIGRCSTVSKTRASMTTPLYLYCR